MKASRTVVALLAVIAVALVVIAAVLVIGVVDRDHTAEWDAAREDASEGAKTFCTILSDDENAETYDGGTEGCVKEHADRSLEDWEEANPDLVWE